MEKTSNSVDTTVEVMNSAAVRLWALADQLEKLGQSIARHADRLAGEHTTLPGGRDAA